MDTLAGKQIIVTRSAHQAASFSAQLAMLGADVKELPVVALKPPDDFSQLDRAISNIGLYDWLIFVSSNAVEFFCQRIKAIGMDIDNCKHAKIAAIGPQTKIKLESYGLAVTFMPASFIADALVKEFPEISSLPSQKILWPRTNVGRELIKEFLIEHGATVDTVQAYKTCLPDNLNNLAWNLKQALPSTNYLTLASSQSAKNLSQILLSLHESSFLKGEITDFQRPTDKQKQMLRPFLADVTLVSIGPETTKIIIEYLGETPLEASSFTADGLIKAIVDHASDERLQRKRAAN